MGGFYATSNFRGYNLSHTLKLLRNYFSILGVSHISIFPTLSITWSLMGGEIILYDAKKRNLKYQFFEK